MFGIFFLFCNSFYSGLQLLSITWTSIITACLLSFFVSVPRNFYNTRTLRAMASLPKGMLLMLGSLLRIRGANKKFIHTQHTANATNQ
jgi:hypothetical protein